MACGIGLKKLHMHNWGVVNSFMWCITTLSGFSRMRGEERAASPLASQRICGYWSGLWRM